MTSRTFGTELATLLESFLSVPVLLYDGNAPQELPCVVVGVTSETVAEGDLNGNYVLEAFILVLTNGYDDEGNDVAQGIHDDILAGINGETLPCLDGMFFNGSTRSDGEESTIIEMKFEAFTHT